MAATLDELYEPYLHMELLEAGRGLLTSPLHDIENAVTIAQELFGVMVNTQVNLLAEASIAVIAPLVRTNLHDTLVDRALHAINDRRGIDRMEIFADDPAVRGALLHALSNGTGAVRIQAARALVHSAGHPAVRDTLLELLADKTWDVRRIAARALGPVLDDPVVDRAIQLLLPDPLHTNPNAIEGLGMLAAHPSVRDALLASLEHPDWFARYSAAGVLQAFVDDPTVYGKLLDLLESTNNDTRTVAAWTLLSAEGQRPASEVARAVDALAQVLADPDRHRRIQAVFALQCGVKQPYAVEALIRATGDRNPSVRSVAIEALEPVAAEPAVTAALVARLSDRHWAPRAYAAFALKPVAAQPGVRLGLRGSLGDRFRLVREWAARSLGGAAGDSEVVAALLSLLSDRVDSVRATAAESLAAVASLPDVQLALLDLLGDRSWQVRAGAAKALGPLATDPTILAALQPLLADPDDTMRRDATEALGPACGDAAVRAVLASMLADPDDIMPTCVLTALQTAPPDRELVQPIGQLTYSQQRDVAEDAYAILLRWRELEAGL